MLILTSICLLFWLGYLLVPFKPWATEERIENTPEKSNCSSIEVTALIPARNEEAHIRSLVEKLIKSNLFKHIIVVNDESTDDTLGQLKTIESAKLTVVDGLTPPNLGR